jgi:serine/threonine protein kinase
VYLVTDLIEGPSLRQAMAESGAFDWTRALGLIRQAADAVTALNARDGFVCGVNPDMIRLRASSSDQDAEQIVISSPGIKSVQDVLATMREQELRGEEASTNELPYLAPEVMMGGAPNARADVFTLGVLAYQMVTGHVPFKANSLPELIGQMLQTKPAVASQIPAAAASAIVRAIESVPANRFESAAAFADALA